MLKTIVEFVRKPRVAVALFILGGGGAAGGLAIKPPGTGSLSLFLLGVVVLGVALFGAFTSDRLS